jgi:ribosome-binding factor A
MSPAKRSGSGSARKTRIEHAMREALTEAIAADVRDPRVHAPSLLTVTKVELNVDLSVAHVYVSIVGEDATADAALEGLKKAAGFLRGPLGRRLGLQHAPELRFTLDPSLDMSEKLAAIVREDEEKARAAGRDPAGATPVGGEAGLEPKKASES